MCSSDLTLLNDAGRTRKEVIGTLSTKNDKIDFLFVNLGIVDEHFLGGFHGHIRYRFVSGDMPLIDPNFCGNFFDRPFRKLFDQLFISDDCLRKIIGQCLNACFHPNMLLSGPRPSVDSSPLPMQKHPTKDKPRHTRPLPADHIV